MTGLIELGGARAMAALQGTFGVIFLFLESLYALFRQVTRLKFRFHETLEQMYAIGVESFPVIAFSLTFTSLMLILELSFNMKLVLRQTSLVPAFSTLLMLRELGPVLTCLLLTSRVGAGIAAEIGSMKVTEQLDALRLLSLDPVEYLLLPRWLGCVFACVSLSAVSIGIAVLAGACIASISLGYTVAEYFNTMFIFTRFGDWGACLTKAAVFGTIIPVVASYQGFHCKLGSEGVGNAATNAVVQSSMLIITADFVLTFLLYAV